ncbi:Ger(x)C family spore germination protein [Oceanobacillus sp. Castelsardo]|uniref:Ger(x)C family spore germination protein n=1 Tax=Oceanobacillus sp. Castelsardo TaxID=1851204 RepID=UPI000837E250|nr:Ger(x)C family spore germination protein [Oceanobacillus sp. Castelsardo]
MKSRKGILFLVVLLLFLSGCWDNVEIEERGFLFGVAIDLAEEQGAKFEMTEQFVVPAGLGTPTEAGGGKAYRNLSGAGETLQEINGYIGRQANRVVNIEHLDFVIISREVAEKEGSFGNVMDVFLRLPDMRRGILLAIADGKASDFLEIEPEQVKIPSQYISELTENKRSSITIGPISMGNIQELMLDDRSFMIPLLSILKENSVEYDGFAVFLGYTDQMVGILEGDEARGVNFIIGKNQGGTITTEIAGDQVSFLILKGKSKVQLKNKDKDGLRFHVNIGLEAQVAEYTGSRDLDTEKEVKRFEKVLNEEVKKNVEDAISLVKDEYKVDVLSLHDHLRMYHYDLWKEVEDNWDHGENYFSKSDITIDVKSALSRPGSSARTKGKHGED